MASPPLILRLLDAVLPPSGGETPDLRRRKRLIVATSVALVLVAIPLCIRLWVTQGLADGSVVTFLVGAVAMLLNPVLLRYRVDAQTVGGIVCLELLAILGFFTWSHGGLESAAVPWTLTLPVVGAFLVGPRFGAGIGIAVTAEVVTFYMAERQGIAFPRPLSDGEMARWRALGFASVAVFLSILGWMYESSRERSYARLLVAREKAEDAARAKERFLANMSHEVRTPLNAIIGLSGLVKRTSLSDEQKSMLGTIETSGEALLGVVNDILTYSRMDQQDAPLSESVFDLHLLLEQSLSMVRATHDNPDVRLRADISDRVPNLVIGSPGPLRQVVINLLVNATKFTAKGEVAIRARVRDDRLQVSVSDTGIGIPTQRIDDVFDAFSQVGDEAKGGAGLGLAISRLYVQRMEGTLTVESALGEGSTFTIDLPLRPAAERSEPTPSTPPGIPAGLRILVADDNPVNRKIMDVMLRRLGLEPDLVDDGAQAVEKTGEETYDLVFMDVQMPVMDGVEAARRIVERGGGPKIVALTAHALPEERQRCEEAGMQGFLTKPVRLEHLQAVLRS